MSSMSHKLNRNVNKQRTGAKAASNDEGGHRVSIFLTPGKNSMCTSKGDKTDTPSQKKNYVTAEYIIYI